MCKVHDMPLALNCYKVRLLCSLLGVEYVKEPIDLLKDEHQTTEFLALNPFGQLPLLKVDDLLIRHSHAILIWIARRFGGEDWMPTDIDAYFTDAGPGFHRKAGGRFTHDKPRGVNAARR